MEYIDRRREQIQRAIREEREQEHWNEVHEQLLAIQKKSLAVNDPGDADEKEADEVARKVVAGESAEIHGTGGIINRKGEGTFETTPAFQSKLESSKGGGQPLDDSTRSEMESKMNADFSGVKIHTGVEASGMNESVNAKAFTHGQDIYFGSNNTPQDKELLAHELVHTVQQGKGINRKIQRVVSGEDADTIAKQLTPHFIKATEPQRNAVLRILSNPDNTTADITSAWSSSPLDAHLDYFIDSFRKIKDFDEFTREILATFKALPAEKRINKISSLLKGEVTSNDAVRILYLMQGLTDEQLREAFLLDTEESNPSKFELFKMALPPGEAERIQITFAHDAKPVVVDSEKIEETALAIYKMFKIDNKKVASTTGTKQERARKKQAKKVDNADVDPVVAVEAYRLIKKLYDISPETEEEFGYRYPLLYNKVMESLPIEFMHSSEFGIQKVTHDPADIEKENAAYHLLYKLSKPYRFLYNHPEAFGNIIVLQGKVNADTRELEKPDLFEERITKIKAEQASNSTLLSDAILYLKAAIPGDFVPTGEAADFDAGLMSILNRVKESNDPLLQNTTWVTKPDGKPDYAYFFALLTSFLDKHLASLEESAQTEEEQKRFAAARELLGSDPQLYNLLVTAPLPAEGQAPQMAEQLEADNDLLTIRTQDPAIFQLITDSTLWEGTPAANARLDAALTIVEMGGYGLQLLSFITGKKIANDPQQEEENENESVLAKHGFIAGTYSPAEWNADGKSKATSATIDAMDIMYKLIDDKLISLYPKKRRKIPRWSKKFKIFMLALHPVQFFEMIRAGAYFMEGLYMPNSRFNSNVGKRAHYEGLDLVTVQEGMGNQIYGMEFGSDTVEKNNALISIDVNEMEGVANVASPALNIKSMNMQYPDMLFTSGVGAFNGMFARITWPPDRTSEGGSTIMIFQSLQLNQLRYQDKGSITTIGKIDLTNLAIYSDQPIANYTQMNNWQKLFMSVMQFVQDILSIITTGIQVSAQRYAPDMIEKVVNPASNPENPEKALSEFLAQRLGENQTLSIQYDMLNVEDLFFNDMGLIKAFSTGPAKMISTNYDIGDGKREMFFGFSGEQMKINDADITGFATDKMGADEFDLGLYFDDPSSGTKNGRTLATLQSLSQLSVQDHPTPVSKLKRMDFMLSGMTAEALTLVGLDMATLPFTDIAGCVEFINGVPKEGQKEAIAPKVNITLSYISNVNFFGLPFPADNSFRLIQGENSKLTGDITDVDMVLTLNDEADQVINGWDIKEVKINSMIIPKLTGNNFSIVTQGSQTTIDEGGTITNIQLKNFVMMPGENDASAWDIKTAGLTTGGIDMKGVGIKTGAGLTTDLHKFQAGSLSFGMVVTNGKEEDKNTQSTKYTYSATDVNATGHIEYTSPEDVYDKTKKPVSVGTDIDMQHNTLSGSYTTNSIDGKTTGSTLIMNSFVELLSIPVLNVTSDKMKITAPVANEKPVTLENVSAAVEVKFDAFGTAESFTIKSLTIDTTSTYGLLITNLAKKKNLVDVPGSVASTISCFSIYDLKMATRKFTPYEISEMKRENKTMPDQNRTWDFNQADKGENQVGFDSSNMPLGLKLAIGESIGVEMTKATSGSVLFDFVTINEFSYSINDLDAAGLKIKDDGKTIFHGEFDSESASGTYKQEIIQTETGPKKKITLSGKVNIPEIEIHKLYIEGDNSLIEIPEDATNTSSVTKIIADYEVTIIEPSENEKNAIKAEAEKAAARLKSGEKMSFEEKARLTKISEMKAHSEVDMTINSMTIEKLQGYGLHIRSASETEVKKSTTPGGKEIESNDSKKFELKLRKNTAATINNVYMKDVHVNLPADDKKKIVMSAPSDGTGLVLGGKNDADGNVIPGIDIGTAEIVTNSVRNLFSGQKQTSPPHVNNTYATTSIRASKLSFGGSTDGEYTVTIDDPEFWFPQNRTGNDDNVSSHTIDYDLDEVEGNAGEYGYGAPKVKSHTDMQVMLADLQGRETPVFSAKSIVLSREKVLDKNNMPVKDKAGNETFKDKIKIVDPVLAEINIKIDNNNDTPGEVHDLEIFVGGDMTGTTLVLEEQDVNFDEYQDKDPAKRKTRKATVLHTENADSDVSFSTVKVIVNKNPETPAAPLTQDQIDALPENDWYALGGYTPSGKFNFLNEATGDIDIALFGEPALNTPLESVVLPDGTEVRGLIDLAAIVEHAEHAFEGTDPYIINGSPMDVPRAINNPYYALTQMQADFDDFGNYVLQNSSLDYDSMILVPFTANATFTAADGRTLVRLSALMDYQANKPDTQPIEPGSNAELAQMDVRDMLNRLMNLTVDFNITVDMEELTSKSPRAQARERSWLKVFNGDEDVTVEGTFDMNQEEETNPNTWQTRKLGPQVEITNVNLPAFRQVLKGDDKKVNSVVSGSGIKATSLSANFDELNLQKLTLEAVDLKIKGFRYEMKK